MKISDIRVVHIITTIERGGAENALLTLTQEQVKHGYQVTVMPLKGQLELKELLEDSGVKVDLLLIGSPILMQWWLLRKLDNEYSVVHSHLPRAEILVFASIRKSPYVVTRHNLEQFFPRAPKVVSAFLSRAVERRSKKVVAISTAVKDFLVSTKELVSPNICVVIHYGYRCKLDTADRRKVKKTNIIEPDNLIRLVTIGRLERQKNLILQLKAVRKLIDRNMNVHLTILGEGSERSSLEMTVRKLGLEHKVDIPGRTSDVFTYLTNSHLFLLTSFYEGFGLALLEAMDAGIPIVAPRNSSIPEVLGSAHPGLFESNSVEALVNNIIMIVKNKEIAYKVLECQMTQLKTFSVEQYFQKHEILYL